MNNKEQTLEIRLQNIKTIKCDLLLLLNVFVFQFFFCLITAINIIDVSITNKKVSFTDNNLLNKFIHWVRLSPTYPKTIRAVF